MASYYSHYQHQPTAANAPVPSHHHGGRSRRAPRVSTSQNSHKQFRGVRSMRELTDAAAVSAYRQKFESARSFDLDDDMEFCPNLLTEDDLVSINSASSDRSSLASASPESSPTQQPQQVTTPFILNSASTAYIPPSYQSQTNQSSSQSSVQAPNAKVAQPVVTRIRNAIPIVNPQTGISMSRSSPPPSVSPARMHQGIGRGW